LVFSLAFFASQPRCLVAMEACASGHYWAREIGALGHETRLIPPAYVKPFVKRQKNDMADAEAICEAAQRPTMRFVITKSAEAQAAGTVFRTRDLLVRQRTQLINALRGHLAEFGMVVRQGAENAPKLVELVMEPTSDLPQEARLVLETLAQTLQLLQTKIAVLDVEITRRAKTSALAKRLMTIPGVGAIVATALVALAPAPETFRRGRDFAAWLGLTPLQHSSGGKERLGSGVRTAASVGRTHGSTSTTRAKPLQKSSCIYRGVHTRTLRCIYGREMAELTSTSPMPPARPA
jgi:transposase